MLGLLQHAFAIGPSGVYAKLFTNMAIEANHGDLLKPLGEALLDDRRAGAAFGLTLHVPLAGRADIARTVAAERTNEVARVAAGLEFASPRQLAVAADNLSRIRSILEADA